MGKSNLAVNQLLERKDVFADLINGSLFGGKELVTAEKLELKSGKTGIMQEKENRGFIARERYGDIRMEADMGTYSVLFAEETQANVDYAMPVRNMLYDALEYTKQINELKKQHKQNGVMSEKGDFLSGIREGDRLKPIVTLVLYCGDCWNGKESLYEMLDIDEESESAADLKSLIPDYKIHLIQPGKMEDMQVFKSCLQHIFSMVKLSKEKDELYEYMQNHRQELKDMDSVETMAAFVLLGEGKRIERFLYDEEKGESVNMCQAIDELIKDGEERGEKRGEKRLMEVISSLLSNGGQELIPQIIQDSVFREEMYQKYQL